MIDFQQTQLGKLHVSTAGMHDTLAAVDAMIHEGSRHYLCFCDSNLFVQAGGNPELRDALNGASMTLPDGVMLVLLSRLTGRPVKERVTGPSFMLAACEYGVAKGYRHFFYGGGEGVAEELAGRLRARFPGLIVAGTHTPPFREQTETEENEVSRMIEAARPDLLWVGLSGPRQVLWMAQRKESISAPVMLGVGAAFDFHSGRVPWAPRWIRRIGMEWAFRTVTGGKRIFLRNVRCVPLAAHLMLCEAWRNRFRENPTR